MGPMLVNTKQKIAVLAAGLVVATTGFVTDQAALASPPVPVSTTHERVRPAGPGNERAHDNAVRAAAKQKAVTLSVTAGGGTAQTSGSKR